MWHLHNSQEMSLNNEILSLSPKQLSCIRELAAGAGVVEAAERVGITQRQIARWKNDERFIAALRAAQRDIYDQSISLIVGSMNLALVTLADICKSSSASEATRVSAARSILESGIKGFGQQELRSQIEDLELKLQDRVDNLEIKITRVIIDPKGAQID